MFCRRSRGQRGSKEEEGGGRNEVEEGGSSGARKALGGSGWMDKVEEKETEGER